MVNMKSSYVATLFWVINWHGYLASAIYLPLREYAGPTFFDRWDFYGFNDNTTWGNVTYLDRAGASSKGLAYVNGAGNAIIKVDNTTNVQDGPLVYRDSIRITSTDTYDVGTLLIIDLLHLPFGCSVWPSFWTLGSGKVWPGSGEIDIIESINLMPNNQVALHSTLGCFQANPPGQTGTTLEGDCSTDRGCIVAQTEQNSFGSGFAQAGGGVYAVQVDVSGVFIWFWSRPNIPDNVRNANALSSMDTSVWGLPSAAYHSASCNITQFFGPQQLILLTTLCGVWAGVPDIYSSTCHTPTGSCFLDNVIGSGSNYADAYWEIQYLRTYLAEGLPLPSSSSSASFATATTTSTGSFPSPSIIVKSQAFPLARGTSWSTLVLSMVVVLLYSCIPAF